MKNSYFLCVILALANSIIAFFIQEDFNEALGWLSAAFGWLLVYVKEN